eukprot:IDg19748t1
MRSWIGSVQTSDEHAIFRTISMTMPTAATKTPVVPVPLNNAVP